MSTDYKAMLESTSNHQPTVSSPTCAALLCCPFCGSKDILVYEVDEESKSGFDNVECNNCGIECYGFTVDDWNKRAS